MVPQTVQRQDPQCPCPEADRHQGQSRGILRRVQSWCVSSKACCSCCGFCQPLLGSALSDAVGWGQLTGVPALILRLLNQTIPIDGCQTGMGMCLHGVRCLELMGRASALPASLPVFSRNSPGARHP